MLLTPEQIDAIAVMYGGAHERLWYAEKARALLSHARAANERIAELEASDYDAGVSACLGVVDYHLNNYGGVSDDETQRVLKNIRDNLKALKGQRR